MMGAFLNLVIKPGPNLDQEKGMVGMQIAWSSVYLIMFALLLMHCAGFVRVFFRRYAIVLLMALVLTSAMWSAVPGTTFRRGISVICTSFFGVYLALRYSPRDQLRLLTRVCTLAVVGSFIFGVLHVGQSVDQLQGVWIGIFAQKNALGRMMVFSALVFLLESKASDGNKRWAQVGLFSAFVLIYLSKSSTSFVAFFVLMAFYLLSDNLRGSVRRVVLTVFSAFCAIGLGVFWMFHHLGAVTEGLHRDVTLTGRLYIWVLGTVMALQKPWFGYGYSAFWLGPEGPSGKIWKALNWAAPGAHNGLLELWLDLGLVGVGLFVVGFLAYARRAVVIFRSTKTAELIWPFMFFAFLVMVNLTESSLLGGNGLFWVLYVAAAVSVSETFRQRALLQQSAAR